jgi:CDP-glucose 4,6-dehydratase
MANPFFWADRRVAVTGHTGFKGAWLCTWLAELGAEVTGIGLPPATDRSLFAASDLPRRVHGRIADVRSRELLARHLREAEPEIVFHLAAQPLVLKSLQDPVATFQSNILGVVNLLDAARRLPSLRTIVVVTSDKCYLRPDRRCSEGDALGGHDPYSASKACAEIVTEAYRCSFFPPHAGVGLATARAGNVIGGGDFSPGRLLPDLIRAYEAGELAELRHPTAVRPWQHVLDALAGYLLLAERLSASPASFATAWNFGPEEATAGWTTARVAEAVADRFGRGEWRAAASDVSVEVPTLLLSSEQAQRWLPWRPRLSTEEAVAWAVDGYRQLLRERGTGWLVDQIHRFEDLGATRARPPASGAPPRARACLRLSRPTSPSSCSAAVSGPGWARPRRCGRSRCSTSARSRCCSTSCPATAASASAGSCSAPATAAT